MSFFFTLFIFVCLRSDEATTEKISLITMADFERDIQIFLTDLLESHDNFQTFIFVLKWFCLFTKPALPDVLMNKCQRIINKQTRFLAVFAKLSGNTVLKTEQNKHFSVSGSIFWKLKLWKVQHLYFQN